MIAASPLQGHLTPTLQLATTLHAKGFSIAIAHSKLNPPDPSNHPSFTFLPISNNLSIVDAFGDFINLIQTLNNNSSIASFREHLTRLISEGNKSIVVIYDHHMAFAGQVALDLDFAAILFRSGSGAFFPAYLVRQQLHSESRFLEQDFVMQEMVPNLYPLRYKDLPFSKTPREELRQLVAIFDQQACPSAVIWNTLNSLEPEPLTQIIEHYQVPVFAVGPLHKITPNIPSNYLKEDTNCIPWLDKQAPQSVIYISFGTVATLDAKVLVEMAWGLAKSNQRFLWAVRPGSVCDSEWLECLPEGFIEETKERGLIVKWAPQKDVLAHFAVGGFWSHCGWNSTLESISEGVPMLCQPFIADQGVNTRYISYVWKIGVELECFERGEIKKMIRKVMVDEEGEKMRLRANDMKEMVKRALENGGSSHDSLEALVNFILST